MGKIEIAIPKDMEVAFEETFPGADKAEAVWQVIRREIERKRASAKQAELGRLTALAHHIRAAGPAFTADEIRRAREEGRP